MTEENKSVKNFPNLRFPGFEGEWETVKLGDITSWCSGGTPSKENPSFWDGEIPWISASSMRGHIYSDSELKITEAGLLKGSRLAKKGSLLILVRGSMLFNKIPIGIVSKDVAFNQDVKSIVVNEKSSSEYILYWFLAFEPTILNIVSGTGIGAGKLDLKDLKDLEVNIPNLIEQKKVSAFLSLIESRIQTQKKIIEQLETLMKASRGKLFSQKFRFKDEYGSDFPAWERKKIKEILTIGSGKDYKHLKNGAIPVYGTGGVITFVDSFLYDGETVCIGRKGTIDKPLYFNGKIWTVDTLFYTYSFNNSVPKFVFNIFQNINWKEYNEASGVPSLSKNTIEKIEISIPCLKEQHKITNYLSSIEDKIEMEKQILEKLELQKKFLLANLFV
ncbi:restriction endonuclease subunit S [Chryseobacterium sp. EZn1]|uniref:restriction endonuclease subunit S n=1 Tax=Chryseobacterium cupriresistens TaxID=3366770 RepID=UPI0039846710